MKYKLRLIRPDIDKNDMLTLDESSIVDTPTIQRQTKQNVKNSIQVKFPERIWTIDIKDAGRPDACSRLTTPAWNWGGSYAYAKLSINGRINIRMTPGDEFMHYSSSGFCWFHGADNYTTVKLSDLRCAIAANQSAGLGDDDYFSSLYQSELKANFWNGDSVPCESTWFIDSYNNGGVGSWSTPINLPLKEGVSLIMSFDSLAGGFACKYRWTDSEGIAPFIQSGAGESLYI